MKADMIHVLIVGAQGVGKSTLIRKVLSELCLPVCGYETKKEDALADPALGTPIYIYPAGAEHIQSPDRLLGYRCCRNPVTFTEAFDRFADRLNGEEDRGIVVLDEIGFMESDAEKFRAAILRKLDGDVPVIAAVKNADTPFLRTVREHPKCRCFCIDESNRDDLFDQVLEHLRKELVI